MKVTVVYKNGEKELFLGVNEVTNDGSNFLEVDGVYVHLRNVRELRVV